VASYSHYLTPHGRKRVLRFINLFPKAIDLMVRALRGGLPISEAIINAGQEIAARWAPNFRHRGWHAARPHLDSLLWDIAKRIDAPEFRFFHHRVEFQRETGGNLPRLTIFPMCCAAAGDAGESPSDGERSARQHGDLGSLPILVTCILMFSSPTYIMPLFSDVRVSFW